MSDDIAIRVRGLGKKHVIGRAQEKYLIMRDAPVWDKESIAEATKDWFKYLGEDK